MVDELWANNDWSVHRDHSGVVFEGKQSTPLRDVINSLLPWRRVMSLQIRELWTLMGDKDVILVFNLRTSTSPASMHILLLLYLLTLDIQFDSRMTNLFYWGDAVPWDPWGILFALFTACFQFVKQTSYLIKLSGWLIGPCRGIKAHLARYT